MAKPTNETPKQKTQREALWNAQKTVRHLKAIMAGAAHMVKVNGADKKLEPTIRAALVSMWKNVGAEAVSQLDDAERQARHLEADLNAG